MDIPELSVKENCISCKKQLKKESKCEYLNYKDREWCEQKNNKCEEACNWCYWYAWDNVSRCETICETYSKMKKKEDQVEQNHQG